MVLEAEKSKMVKLSAGKSAKDLFEIFFFGGGGNRMRNEIPAYNFVVHNTDKLRDNWIQVEQKFEAPFKADLLICK